MHKISEPISDLTIMYTLDYSNNSMVFLNTASTSDITVKLSVTNGMYINKAFDPKPNKSYLIACDKNIIVWTEVSVATPTVTE